MMEEILSRHGESSWGPGLKLWKFSQVLTAQKPLIHTSCLWSLCWGGSKGELAPTVIRSVLFRRQFEKEILMPRESSRNKDELRRGVAYGR